MKTNKNGYHYISDYGLEYFLDYLKDFPEGVPLPSSKELAYRFGCSLAHIGRIKTIALARGWLRRSISVRNVYVVPSVVKVAVI